MSACSICASGEEMREQGASRSEFHPNLNQSRWTFCLPPSPSWQCPGLSTAMRSSPRTLRRPGGQKADKCSGITLPIAEYKGFTHSKKDLQNLFGLVHEESFDVLFVSLQAAWRQMRQRTRMRSPLRSITLFCELTR